MKWQQHSGFVKEYKAVCRKHRMLDDFFVALKKLLAAQFDPVDPKMVIAPGKIHRVHVDNDEWELWKVEMVVRGVRPSQFPRAWFAVSGDTVTFLAIHSHTENYDNNTVDREAAERYDEVA